MRIKFFVGIIILFFVITGSIFFMRRETSPLPAHIMMATTTPVFLPVRQAPEGWKEYQNASYHFSLYYPADLAVHEYPEGGNAMTITFQNTQTVEGFQVFIVPYAEAQVSQARFAQDVPSGVRTDLSNIEVDGATGAAFYSNSIGLGDTREIWFIKNGFLYEVTTLKSLESWFAPILHTWVFR